MATRVAVACGGRSLEREVSLRSGGRAADALTALGYDVTVLDPDARFVRRIRELRPDFVFVAMHGRGGEDGTLQDLLEILGVPYTGSDVHASGRCLDKHSFKQLMQAQGLDTPEWHSFNREAFSEFGAAESLDQLAEQLGLPFVLKPARQGSSLGIKFVETPEQFGPAIVGALGYDERVVIERYVSGRELAVTVLGPADDPDILPMIEIETDEPSTPSARTTTRARPRCARRSSTTTCASECSPWRRRPTRPPAVATSAAWTSSSTTGTCRRSSRSTRSRA